MQYNLKEKIKVTKEFLDELITKSWQEAESLQQQIVNINTSTQLGAEVVKLLKNTCTNYYVLIGCLEALVENPSADDKQSAEPEALQNMTEPEVFKELVMSEEEPKETINLPTERSEDFEPFEYFVDFDEPVGEPLSDKDLYG